MLKIFAAICGFAMLTLACGRLPGQEAKPQLPTVMLIGDSIRLSYAAGVAKALDGKARVVGPKANGGDSANVLKHLDEWLGSESVVHFNCGIHDTKRFTTTEKFQVPPEQYEANLRAIVQRIRQAGATPLFATTTPILDDRATAARRDRDYVLLARSVEQYNEIARRVMKELNVPINDLHASLTGPSVPKPIGELIGADGVHLTPAGQTLAAKTIATFVEQRLPGIK